MWVKTWTGWMRKCLWNDWHAEEKRNESKGGIYQKKQGNVPREFKNERVRGALKKKHLFSDRAYECVKVSNCLSAADVFNTDAVISFTPGKDSYTVFHLTRIFPYSVTGRLSSPAREEIERFLVFVYHGEEVIYQWIEILSLSSTLRFET